ncbi:MAG TPA: hypothetical protein VGM44_16765 [Polyangiaceae bacterium]
MTTRDPSHFSGQYRARMPKPVIPMRHMPIFMKALWLLAFLVVAGVAYSFWRISTVASPKIDVPTDKPWAPGTPAAAPATSQPT